jgi:hypothetical protein
LSLGYQIPDSGHDNVLDILKEHIPAFEKRNKIKKMIRIKQTVS